MLHEREQDAVFVAREREPLSAILKRRIRAAQLRAAAGKRAHIPGKVVGSAKQRQQLGVQNGGVKGLGNEIVRAERHGGDDAHVVCGGGDEYDGRLGEPAQLLTPCIPGLKRQGKIHEHKLRVKGREGLRHMQKVGNGARLKAPCAKMAQERVADQSVVLNDQNTVHAHSLPATFAVSIAQHGRIEKHPAAR